MDKSSKQPVGAAEEMFFKLAPLEATLAADAIKPAANAAQIRRYCLSGAGVRILDLELHAQNPLSDMLVKSFDPKKANEIFLDMEGVIESSMQQCVGFRSVVYGLADVYPECLLVKYSLRRMSRAGYKDEVDCFLTATRQAKEFMDVLNLAITNNFDFSAVSLLTKLISEKPFMYAYSMVFMQELLLKSKLGQMMKQAMRRMTRLGRDSKLDLTPISIASKMFVLNPQVCNAIFSIVANNVLSCSDVVKLFVCCKSRELEQVMQNQLFVDLLVDSLFRVDVPQDIYLDMRIHLLGYATSAPTEREELTKKITLIHTICKEWPNKQEQERDRNIEAICGATHHPVIGACVLRWIEDMVAEPHYFCRCFPVERFMKLVDTLSIHHSTLHGRILHMLIRLFEGTRNKEGSEIMNIILHDRLMVLSKQGYAQANRYVDLCYMRGDIRKHFI